jgi:hypothetical protein
MTTEPLPSSAMAFMAWPQAIIPEWLIALVMRVGVAGVFFLSGRTKVDGVLHITDSTYALFASEYRLPLVSPYVAAHLGGRLLGHDAGDRDFRLSRRLANPPDTNRP